MRLNWIGYYLQYNSYAIVSTNFVKNLQHFGVEALPITEDDVEKPQWMLDQIRVSWKNLSIVCNEPRKLLKVPGLCWLSSMCEGDALSSYMVKKINKSGIDRIVVPCQFCKDVYEDSKVKIPISIVPLGVDPLDFPMITNKPDRPYTFLTIADRGDRKGWTEVFDAFYKAFGGRTTGTQDVRLIIKSLPGWNRLAGMIKNKGTDLDPRIIWDINHYENMADFYSKGDCLVLPSRSEGWGLPHREVAVMGIPVILQKYAGLNDGFTEKWAITCEGGRMEPIPRAGRLGGGGRWMIADIYEVADRMRSAYDYPERASRFGYEARNWLIDHQTWMDSAAELINLIYDELGSENGTYIQHPSNSYVGTSSSRIPIHNTPIWQESGTPASS
jgi:glycosyltransferase involved in cell wall biosynthesis